LNYDVLIAFIMATGVLAISPGPDNIYVLTQSISNGRLSGLVTTAGLISGCIIHTALLAFGVSAILRESDSLFFLIKLLGACYLFFLAYRVFRANPSIILKTKGIAQKNLPQLFRQGFIMNVLNPKVTIFFLAFFPGFLFSERLDPVIQFFVLGLLFMTVSFIIFAGIAMLAGSISAFLDKSSVIGIVLKWLQFVVFVGIGIYLLISDK
jgi:threonine/homoserine/homoserine lactone efflux protein